MKKFVIGGDNFATKELGRTITWAAETFEFVTFREVDKKGKEFFTDSFEINPLDLEVKYDTYVNTKSGNTADSVFFRVDLLEDIQISLPGGSKTVLLNDFSECYLQTADSIGKAVELDTLPSTMYLYLIQTTDQRDGSTQGMKAIRGLLSKEPLAITKRVMFEVAM
jgi:hypothetical protein